MKSKSNPLLRDLLTVATFAFAGAAQADDFTTDLTGLWSDAIWNPGLVSGPTANTDTATINGGQVTINSQTINSAITVASGAILVANAQSGVGDVTLGGNLAGSGTLNKTGAWTLRLGGDNSGFSGTINANSSNVFFTADSAGSAAADWVISSGNVVNNQSGSGRLIKLGSLAGSGGTLGGGNASGAAATFEIGGNGKSTTFGGQIMDTPTGYGGGTASITKVGSGTLTLSATNTYSGATNVESGKLVINGSISTSTTTVKTTGTLGGSGTVGAVIVQAGGTLAPGNSPGNITGISLSLADNANFDIEINKSLTPRNDSVTLTGNFSNVLAITTGANLNLALTGTVSVGDRFTLADYNTISGAWNGGLFNLGAGTSTLADDSVFQYGSYDWRINYDDLTNGITNSTESYTDGGKYLTLTVVPEPGAALLGGLGMLALLRRRRA